MMNISPNNPLIEVNAANILFMNEYYTISGSEYDNC